MGGGLPLPELKERQERKKAERELQSVMNGKATKPMSPALRKMIEEELQRKGAIPTPAQPWDQNDTPLDARDISSIRGAGRELFETKDFETVLTGGFETAKTFSCCKYINALLWKYPGANGVMTRKTYSSLIATAVQTYERVARIKDPGCKIKAYGGNKPEWYDYPNGSRLWVAGFDNPQKVLSGERDFFYLNQGEDFALEEYETITGRATGRGAVMPYTRVVVDCNPGPASHWILHRSSLRLIKSYLDDNPTLWEPAPAHVVAVCEEWPDVGDRGGIGRWTEQGKRSLDVLNKFTGVRYQRYRLGNWASAEGAVYENFDPIVHTCEPFPIPADWRRIRCIDFGYSNPFVCLWIAIDPDGRMFVYREIYLTHLLVSEAARLIIDLSSDEKIETTICDHDLEDRETLKAMGIRNVAAYKAVKPGIDAVERQMKVAGDGKARLQIFRNSTANFDPHKWTYPRTMPDANLVEKKHPLCLAQEMEFYVWAKDVSGKPNKEEPVKEFDHGCDALRYGVALVSGIAKKRIRAA